MRVPFLFLLYFASIRLVAQMDTNRVTVPVEGVKLCDPKLIGMARSKAFSISYGRIFDHSITSVSRDGSIGGDTAIVDRHNRFEVKGKFPIWNSPRLKIIGGIEYSFEEFNFKTDQEASEYGFYSNIQSKHLQSLGLNFNFLVPLTEVTYTGFRATGDLNGDYTSEELPTSSFVKYSFSAVYGWKRCPTKSTGIGVFVNYTLGRRSIYPVFIYNNTFNKRWGIEAIFPAFVKARFNFSRKSILYFGYEVDGASYNLTIKDPPLANYASLQLRRSTVLGLLTYEQEIYDFLWIGISAGIRQPLSFNVTTQGDRPTDFNLKKFKFVSSDPLIRNNLGLAPFVQFTLFIVPPRKLENKILGRE